MSEPAYTCWICTDKLPAPAQLTDENYVLSCARCGRHRVSASLFASVFPLPDQDRYRMSHWSRLHAVEGREPPHFTNHTIEGIKAALPLPRTSEKAGLLLSALGKLFPIPGQTLAVDWSRDYPLACARAGGEIKYHFRWLGAEGYLHGEGNNVQITPKGWERIEQLQTDPNVSKAAFVAIRFSDELLAAYREGFAPAIEKAGFQPVLANQPQHNEKIDARIMTLIKQSRFVVADSTERNAGVYFEAGYALGLGRQVIWTCREENEKDLHFDNRQYNHILWKSPAHLLDELYYRIVATI